MSLASKVINQTGSIREFEKPEVCEAIKVANANKWTVGLSPIEWDEREARLKKEDEKHAKAPVFGEVEAGDDYLKKATDAFILQENEIMRLKKKNAELLEAIDKMKKGNPALKEAATQFNDALLDEQAKKIKRLGKEIARLNGIIHDKNAILADVAEELRLSKIREKNLTEVGQKYMKEVEAQKDLVDDISLKYDGAKYNLKLRIEECEELKKLLADKVGNGIDWKRNADAIQLYVNRASHERLWNSINQDICNEKELSFIINHGGKRVKYALRFDGTDIVYECSDPDKKPSFFRDDSVGAVTNMKDCSPAKDTHLAVDIAEEGGDHSDVIVLCGKDFIDAIKKMK